MWEPITQAADLSSTGADTRAGVGAPQAGAAVQHKGAGAAVDVHAVAAEGIAGPAGALPHLDLIQRSFGPDHDLSGIRAHTDGAARHATAEMGATGYATGNHVAFAGTPDLHLAAHEAAHVVQQRAGVQLAGGVGQANDAYERNADAVADRVVAGQSAADLLPSAQSGTGAQLQHKAERASLPGDHDIEAMDAAREAADGEQELEADAAEEESAANVELIAGKPPGAVQKREQSGPPAPRSRAARRSRALSIQEATVRYAPLVFLAPGETNGPADASAFIRSSSLRWSHERARDHEVAGRGHVDEERLGAGGYSHQENGFFGHHGDPIHSNEDSRPKDGKGAGGDEGFFLDVDDSERANLSSGTNAPVYHEAVNGRYITYWFFYAYNKGPAPLVADNHEGDWERIVVKLNQNNRATQVAYFQHNDHSIKRWRDVPKQGSHPLVFSAKGSHASYDSPGKKSLLGGLASDDAGFGAKWQTWQHLKDARKQGWYGYGGAWGEVGEIKGTTGPQGPSRHKGAAPKGW